MVYLCSRLHSLEDEMGDSTIDHTYGLLIARLAHIHRTRIDEYLSTHHLHVGQEMLLKYLWNQDGLSQKEIGELMEIQSATVTEVGLGSLRKSITSILSYEWFLQ